MFLVWRLVFAAIGSRPAALATTFALRVVGTLRGRAAAESIIARFESRFVYSGWPRHPKGWTNIHMSAAASRIRRRFARAAARPRRKLQSNPVLRIGLVGRFSGLLLFPRELFERIPSDLEVSIFDIVHNGSLAGYLRPLAARYSTADLDTGGLRAAAVLADAINAANLDVLVNVNWRREAVAVLDQVDTPCVINYCTGSDLLHHPRVAVQLHAQPQADYFVVGRRMFCGLTRSFVGGQRVHSIRGFYDRRGLSLDGAKPWSERKSLIVVHGGLYKLASAPFLDVLCRIMQHDSSIEFAFMGVENTAALRFIFQQARSAGVAGRFHYHGQFSSMRSAHGDVDDVGWTHLRLLLEDARLAPDPWPIGGGCSRVEAYALGAPTVHMAVRFDDAAHGKPQAAAIDLPAMQTSLGTATTPEEYHNLCLKCLYQEDYAESLRAEQLAICGDLTDTNRWWNDLRCAYDEWRHSAGAIVDGPDAVDERARERSVPVVRARTGA